MNKTTPLSQPLLDPFTLFPSPYVILATTDVLGADNQIIGKIQIHSCGSSFFKVSFDDGASRYLKLRFVDSPVQDAFYKSISPMVLKLRTLADQLFIDTIGEVETAKLYNKTISAEEVVPLIV